jgi:hypothetical protein
VDKTEEEVVKLLGKQTKNRIVPIRDAERLVLEYALEANARSL